MNDRLSFASDYLEGAHPSILKRLADTNWQKLPGYGFDEISLAAKDKIRQACHAPNAEVEFLVGGTQANAVMIDALLQPYQGVAVADTGHISVHEAGAIEAGGHKVLTLPGHEGKITAAQIAELAGDYAADANHDHMVMPGMVYLSQPTEFGTLYTKSELQAIHDVCQQYDMKLYVDGARLSYALACTDISEGKSYALTEFIKRCITKNIMVYICGLKRKVPIYSTVAEIIKAGSIPIYTTSAVAAYMKLLLAYNQEEMPVKEVMGKDLFFEEVKFS